MSVMTKTRIIRIGNSHGIRIPKLLLEQVGFDVEVEVEAQNNQIVIRPARRARHGWDEQFKAMAERGDDRLLDEKAPSLTEWDAEQWEW